MLDRLAIIAASVVIFPAHAAAGLPPPAARTIPAAIDAPSPSETGPWVMSWQASEVTCDNAATFGAAAIPPRIPQLSRRRFEEAQPATFSFTLGEAGRPLSITQEEDGQPRTFTPDLAPALAAAQFAPQPRATTCHVTFTQTATPVEEAALGDLVALRIYDRRARIPKRAWDRFAPGGCHATRLRLLEHHNPDYRKLPKLPGAPQWTFLTYNIDEDGQPLAIKTVESSGSDALDLAARAATADSRWVDGDPRTGCWRYNYTAADVIEAPQAPDTGQYGESPAPCESDDRWAKPPRLVYPTFYQRRGIEGWAVLRYDVASWGEIGNVELIDAQPTRELGEQARRVLESAQYKPVAGGLTGCIERVSFVLPLRADGAEQDVDAYE